MLTFKPSKLEEKVNKFLFFGKARRKAHDYLREKLGYIGSFLSQDAVSDSYGVLAMIPFALLACNGGSDYDRISAGGNGTGNRPGVITGIVVKDTGNGLVGVVDSKVTVQENGSYDTTDANGAFKIENIQPGTYTLLAEKDGDADGNIELKTQVDGVYLCDTCVSIDAGQIMLDQVGAIAGRALRDGNPTGNLGITVFIPGTSYIAMTDDSGNFTISWIQKGTHSVAATYSGCEPALADGIGVMPAHTTTIADLVLSCGGPTCTDSDSDTFYSTSGCGTAVDCNDSNPNIHPGAVEVCNDVDDNCGGGIDEGVKNVYYRDSDGDTFGDSANSTMACSLPSGFVADNTDCNDSDAGVYPSAPELCDGKDNQCPGDAGHGTIDEACATGECNDGIDNDGDTLTDFPADYGCHGLADASETFQQIDIPRTELNSSNNNDAMPFITADGLGIYFSSDRETGYGWDFYHATRPDTSSPFNAPTMLSSLSTDNPYEGDVWLSDDELRAYFTRQSDFNRIYTVSRTDKNTDSFGTPTELPELRWGNSSGGATLLSDELTVFFSNNNDGPNKIYMATRPSIGSAFTPTEVSELNSGISDVDTCISRDGLAIFFNSSRPPHLGGGDLWYSWRTDLSSPWAQPVKVVELSTDKQEGLGKGCMNFSNELQYYRDSLGTNNSMELYYVIR